MQEHAASSIRDPGALIRLVARVRGSLMLAAMVFVSSCVMPLSASRTDSTLIVALDPPIPFDPALLAVPAMSPADPAAAPVDPALFAPTMLVAGPSAIPYVFKGRNATDYLRAATCLTSAIYYEAANEPDEGQRAVAQVVLNRVRHPAYPNTVCGVVYQGTDRNDTLCQFTFGCDGAMARGPSAAGWARARRVAMSALAGTVYAPVGTATHYHTLAVNPVWNKSLTPTAIIGAHIFFRWPGGAGSPSAFHDRYVGFEPFPGPKPKLPLPAVPFALVDAGIAPLPVAPMAGIEMAKIAGIVAARPVAADKRYVPGTLPESDVLPEYRNSGQWISR